MTILSCGCVKSFEIRPQPRDKIYCVRCSKTVQVANDTSIMFKIACQQCRYTRNYGAAPLTASVKAVSHATKRNHIVEIIDSEGWAELVGNLDRAQMILF